MPTQEHIEARMRELADILQYEYRDLQYLCLAMNRTKLSESATGEADYENSALATLGDSILKFVLTEVLYKQGYRKGEITKIKERIECNKNLARMRDDVYKIRKYHYNACGFYGKTPLEAQVAIGEHDAAIEAVIGAMYLDRGLEYTRQWIFLHFGNQLP